MRARAPRGKLWAVHVSLRLRILLLIAAVNVGVLLLVVWLGLKSAETASPVGPQALLEAWRVALAEDLRAYRPWRAVRYVIRAPRGSGEWDWAVPPDDEEEARAIRQRLLQKLRAGVDEISCDRQGLTFVSSSGGAGYPVFHVAFNENASFEALESLRSVYIVLCGGTLLLILATYLFLRRLVLKPLDELVEASRAVAEGRTHAPVRRPHGEHEVANLVDNFNKMAQEVAEYQAHLEERVLDALGRAKAAEGRLVVAQRLAATGSLAAGFAHEINNPLGGILNALRKLREGGLGPEREEEYFGLAQDGLGRIRTIVERILHFTPQQREPTEIDVAEIGRRAADLARHRADRHGIRLEVDPPAGSATQIRGVVGDPQELTQAVLNLVLNSIDAVRGVEGREGGTVRVRARRADQEVLLEVSDDGIGMDSSTRDRCLDLFFSTKAEGEGTGLGLAIVQHIVTDHGGFLEIESEPGKGTTVRLRLPVGAGG